MNNLALVARVARVCPIERALFCACGAAVVLRTHSTLRPAYHCDACGRVSSTLAELVAKEPSP